MDSLTDDCSKVTTCPHYPKCRPCVICDQPTASTQRASIGGRTGAVCGDCAYWCDGNLTA